MIQQAPARLPCYEKIRVAVLIGFTSGHRAEHAQGVGAAPLGEPEHFFPPFRAKSPRVRSLKVMNVQLKID